jgi:hypothetical protein
VRKRVSWRVWTQFVGRRMVVVVMYSEVGTVVVCELLRDCPDSWSSSFFLGGGRVQRLGVETQFDFHSFSITIISTAHLRTSEVSSLPDNLCEAGLHTEQSREG